MNFDLVTCTLSERDTGGLVRCQPDPYGKKGTAPTHEAFLPFGIGGRPKAPTNGKGAYLLQMRHGDETFVLPGHDPRWMPSRPDFGDGGAPLVATTELDGSKVSPYVAIFGEGAEGGEAEGLFRISIPSSVGTTTIEVNPSTGDITITHPGGATVVIKGTSVELGAASGGGPLMKYTEFAAAWATLTTNGAAIGLTVPALTGVATTKVNGT